MSATSNDHDSLGPVIVDGVLRYVSPSSIDKFYYCERQWGFRYIERIPEPTTLQQQVGIDGHKRIEHYLNTGEDVLTDLERPGRIWIPAPLTKAPGTLLVEYGTRPGCDAWMLAGVPVVTRIDLLDASGRFVDQEGEAHATHLVEVKDWKFSSDPGKWAKSADEVRVALPMMAYARTALEFYDGKLAELRVSHVNFATKKRYAFLRSAVVSAGHVAAELKKWEPVVERMKEAARARDPNDLALPEDMAICSKYKGCPYQGRCRRSPEAIIRSMFRTENKEKTPMGMIDGLTPPAPTPTPTAPAGPSMADRLAALKSQEQAERAARAAAAPPHPAIGFRDRIAAAGVGLPAFAPAFVPEIVKALGHVHPDGEGELAGYTVHSMADYEALAIECDKYTAEKRAAQAADISGTAPAAAAPAIEPPDAPVQTKETGTAGPAPVAVAAPAEAPKKRGRGRPKKAAAAEGPATTDPVEDALPSLSDVDVHAPGLGLSVPPATPAPVYPGEGALSVEDLALLAAGPSAPCPETYAVKPGAKMSGLGDYLPNGIELYVDCVPMVGPAPDLSALDAYLDGVLKHLASEQTRGGVMTIHVLCAPKNSMMAYGGWEGVLLEYVRANPPPAGRYAMLNVRGGKLREALVEALRPLCRVYVRGV